MKRKLEISISKADLLNFASERGCLSGLDAKPSEIAFLVEKGDTRITFVPEEPDRTEIIRLVIESDDGGF